MQKYSDVEKAMEYAADTIIEFLEMNKLKTPELPKPAESETLSDKPKQPVKKFRR